MMQAHAFTSAEDFRSKETEMEAEISFPSKTCNTQNTKWSLPDGSSTKWKLEGYPNQCPSITSDGQCSQQVPAQGWDRKYMREISTATDDGYFSTRSTSVETTRSEDRERTNNNNNGALTADTVFEDADLEDATSPHPVKTHYNPKLPWNSSDDLKADVNETEEARGKLISADARADRLKDKERDYARQASVGVDSAVMMDGDDEPMDSLDGALGRVVDLYSPLDPYIISMAPTTEKKHFVEEEPVGEENVNNSRPNPLKKIERLLKSITRNPTTVVISRDSNCPDKEQPYPLMGPNKEDIEDTNRTFVVQFSWPDVIFGLIAIGLFFLDMQSECELAVQYFRNDQWVDGVVTLSLVLCPSLIISGLGIVWYLLDYKEDKGTTSSWTWALRFGFTVLQLGPVFRSASVLYYGLRSRAERRVHEQARLKAKMCREDLDGTLLSLFDAFLKAAPQLTWQLYLLVLDTPRENTVDALLRIRALATSWILIAWSLVSYCCLQRVCDFRQRMIPFLGIFPLLIWRACEIGGRILCLSLFASSVGVLVFAVVSLHWLLMAAWNLVSSTSFYGHRQRCLERSMNIVCGYVMVFCFLNLCEGSTFSRYVMFYCVMYLENSVMALCWYFFTPDPAAWFHPWALVALAALFVLHIGVLLLYYALFHPKPVFNTVQKLTTRVKTREKCSLKGQAHCAVTLLPAAKGMIQM